MEFDFEFGKMTEKQMFETLENLKGKHVILNFTDGSEIHSFEGEIIRFNNYVVRLKEKNGERGFNLRFLVSGREVK